MDVIGVCIGGCCDGEEMDPPDPDKPLDWPEQIVKYDYHTGARELYELLNRQTGMAELTLKDDKLVAMYYAVDYLDALEISELDRAAEEEAEEEDELE